MRDFELKPSMIKTLKKLSKKDKDLHKQVLKKIDEVISCYDVEHYKNLRYNLKESKRTHVGHFVLVFSYDKKLDIVSFEDFDHHDKIYKK